MELMYLGKKNIIETIQIDTLTKYYLISWNKFPTTEQLEYLFSLAWSNLLNPNESVRPMT
jgi:hypothetical protein